MIVITGAAGFIGSCLTAALNQAGYYDLVLVDDFSRPEKEANYRQKRYSALVDRDQLFDWIDREQAAIQYVFHLGARTDTTEFDVSIHTRLNLEYSKKLWAKCVDYGLPLTYASSAATYGDGAFGFDDDLRLLPQLKPLNPYGDSKHAFDIWALAQERKPFQWVGLKFLMFMAPMNTTKVVWPRWFFMPTNKSRSRVICSFSGRTGLTLKMASSYATLCM